MSSRILEEIRNMGFEAHKTLIKAVETRPDEIIYQYMLEKAEKYLEQSDDVDLPKEEDTIE